MARPLLFTFGNHMHWVDMQWLWGYGALPDSIDDMLALCEAVGVKGNVNFDGVGYEKLAAEAPEALARLREAVGNGTVEVVGASYGQPYGLFQGGESNVRQRTFGARAVRRLLGQWPVTFWEEEFDFFPQLPQILAGTGFTGACMFFQWTWHTPTVPEEAVPLVVWEGIDGTRLRAVAKTALCMHQWPEDFDGLLDEGVIGRFEQPAIVQWLELMPSPDWMCRSEVLLPRLRELCADPRFEIVPVTLGGLIEALDDGTAPVRRYTMDDVFHGVSLGKNADHMPRTSHRAEESLLAAESIAAVAGLGGRPYASWDVYPSWELDEAWRELLQAQHHDNHECEGLCGAIGELAFERSLGLSHGVFGRTLDLMARRVEAPGGGATGATLVFNQLGWSRDIAVELEVEGAEPVRARAVPPFGWRVVDAGSQPVEPVRSEADDRTLRLSRGGSSVTVCRHTGGILAVGTPDLGGELSFAEFPVGLPTLRCGGRTVAAEHVEVGFGSDRGDGAIRIEASGAELGWVEVYVTVLPELPGASLFVTSIAGRRPDPGMHAGLTLALPGTLGPGGTIRHDTPYAVSEVRAERDHVRKYPTGDWMTSEQWFETVRRPFTSLSFVDLRRGPSEPSLLVLHDGSQAWFRQGDGVSCLLSMYDPWDEDHYEDSGAFRFALCPHRGMSDTRRARLAQEHVAAPLQAELFPPDGGGGAGGARRDLARDLPSAFGAVDVATDADNVAVTAFYREHEKAREHVAGAFGQGVRNPFVVRLVELDGEPTAVTLAVPGPCPSAAKTDLLGRVALELAAAPCAPPGWAPPGPAWSAVRFTMRPREIATVMLDLELGRHEPRNLDRHRGVWARVHKHTEKDSD